MNLLYETKQRISFSNIRLTDLKECLKKENISKDAATYLNDEIKKSEKNIKYYSELLKELER